MSHLLESLLTRAEVLSLRKVSKSKHHADVAAKIFPAPVKIGRRSYFLASEVRAWLDRHVAERDARLSQNLGKKSA